MNYFRAKGFCFQAFLIMFFDNKGVTSRRNKTSWFCGIYCQNLASTLVLNSGEHEKVWYWYVPNKVETCN